MCDLCEWDEGGAEKVNMPWTDRSMAGKFERWYSGIGSEPVITAQSAEAPRGTVSSVKEAEEAIARLVKLTDSCIPSGKVE